MLVGATLGAVAYFGPNGNTGVDGTPGALLALIGAIAVVLGTLIAMMPQVRGWALRVLNVLILIGAVLTATAALFLMQYPFAVAMALAALGVLLAVFLPKSRRPA